MENKIRIVIGYWGSYNECNKRALDSKWLTLNDYSSWEEIEEELIKEGFELNGIDEELFIQDIEGIDSDSTSWDYVSPEILFDALQDSRVLESKYQYEKMTAYIEARSLDEFFELVNKHRDDWDQDVYFYKDYSWEDYGREMFENSGYKLDDRLEDFFDFEAYGRYIGDDYAVEVDNGIIEIL